MKTINIFGMMFLILGVFLSSNIAQTSKYAALAIDKSNGFYYSWAYDQASMAEAEARAVAECAKLGGKCSIVLMWVGTGCGVYKTLDKNDGSAYGWGLAVTQQAADEIATREVLKRSNGKPAQNFVYACNSANSGTFRKILDANEESKQSEGVIKTVKIGSQTWMAESLTVSVFRNGDTIPQAKSDAEWAAASDAGKPIWRYLQDKPENGIKYGKLYNWYAVNDSRGLAPKGFHIPSKAEWELFFNSLGDKSTAGGKLRSRTDWKKNNGTDDYGFNALPGGNTGSSGSFYGIGGVAMFWSSDPSDDRYIWYARLYDSDQSLSDLGEYPRTAGMYVRCIKD